MYKYKNCINYKNNIVFLVKNGYIKSMGISADIDRIQTAFFAEHKRKQIQLFVWDILKQKNNKKRKGDKENGRRSDKSSILSIQTKLLSQSILFITEKRGTHSLQ